jgi:LmbE family N-acetylglucosaminyl deacetylase
VLVLAPHPDDETIGCGGAILLHRRRGDEVKVVFVTDGAAGDPRRFYRGRDYVAVRRREARRAARVLGVGSLEFWKHPDGALAGSPGLPGQLKDLLSRERPDIVYLPFAGDAHPDHQALAKAYKKAVGRSRSRALECRYEIWSMMRRVRVADISAVFEKKLEALRQYRSQLRCCDYLERITRLNSARALFLPRSRRAEAFELRARLPGGGEV